MEQVYDPWTVPQPSLITNSNQVPLKTRYVWFALLHIEKYPIYAADIYNKLIELGYTLEVSQIGHIMKTLCKRGYFKRTVYKRHGAGPYYLYDVTNVFTQVQDKWRQGD